MALIKADGRCTSHFAYKVWLTPKWQVELAPKLSVKPLRVLLVGSAGRWVCAAWRGRRGTYACCPIFIAFSTNVPCPKNAVTVCAIPAQSLIPPRFNNLLTFPLPCYPPFQLCSSPLQIPLSNPVPHSHNESPSAWLNVLLRMFSGIRTQFTDVSKAISVTIFMVKTVNPVLSMFVACFLTFV
jgi:hypothetical protein